MIWAVHWAAFRAFEYEPQSAASPLDRQRERVLPGAERKAGKAAAQDFGL